MVPVEVIYLGIGTILGAGLTYLGQHILQQRQHTHERTLRRDDEVRRVYLDYLLLAQRIPIMIKSGVVEGSSSDVLDEVEEELARFHATLRLYAPEPIRAFVRDRIPKALERWHARVKELGDADMALPRESRVGYIETQHRAFLEKLSPELDELARLMREDLS